MGNEENQRQVSLVSHSPWKSPCDSHIPTAPATTAWESGNPAFGFPLSHAVVAGAVGMWESHGDFQGLWETRETCLWFSSFPIARHFHSPPGLRWFMRFFSHRSWRTAFVFPAAFSAPQRCRWSGPLSGSTPLPSAPASSTAPDPAPAAESPTASHTIGTLFSACPWLRSPLPELRRAGESSNTD